MGILALAVFAHLSQGVAVPPISQFKTGRATKGDFILTVHDGANPKKVVPGKLIFLEKAIEAAGVRVYALTLSPQLGDISTFEFKTNATGVPFEAKQVPAPEQPDPMNILFILLQRPLWPESKLADTWIAKIPNPTDPAKKIDVDCTARIGTAKNTLMVYQSSKTSLVEQGFGALIESQLTVDAKSGVVKTIHESISLVKEGKASLVLEYDGKY